VIASASSGALFGCDLHTLVGRFAEAIEVHSGVLSFRLLTER